MNLSGNNATYNFTQSDQDSEVNSTLNLKGLNLVPVYINVVLGLPSNIYVLWLIAKGGRESVASDFFALNLSVEEILFSVFCLLYTYVGGRSVGILNGLIYTGRPLFQCCICVERYLAVVHPMVFLKYKHLRHKVVSSSLVWLVVCGTSSACMVFVKHPSVLYSVNCVLLLCFSVKVFCCLAVLKALKRPGPGEGERERVREGTNNFKMRAFKIILLILISMLFNYVPVMLLIVVSLILAKSSFTLAVSVSFSFVVLTGFVQPLLYLQRSGKLSCQKA